jgi:hypothetical protein
MIGLFGVFPAGIAIPANDSPSADGRSASPDFEFLDDDVEEVDPDMDDDDEYMRLSSIDSEPTLLEVDPFQWLDNDIDSTLVHHPSLVPRYDVYNLEPSLYNSLAIRAKEERQLMHYWIHGLSPLMMPVQSCDNPFQTVMVPLALSAFENTTDPAGASALLNSIYAIAAVSQGNLGQTKFYGYLSAKYLRLCFQQLRQSLLETNTDSPEATLSAITLLIITGILNGQTTNWRIHLQGAFAWLQSINRSAWKRNRNASTVYDIFLCIESLRPAQPKLALELRPCELFLDKAPRHKRPYPEHDDWSRVPADQGYCLDTVFGIASPILETIIQIHRWVYSAHQPSARELNILEAAIIWNDLNVTPLSESAIPQEQMTRLHTELFHVATYLYLCRSLRNMPSRDVQHLVRRSITLLDAIMRMEAGLNVSGLLWPAFIVGCEAGEPASREAVDAYFDKREKLSIGNVTDARRTVREVWRRRDVVGEGVDITWHGVMAELGIDILLS